MSLPLSTKVEIAILTSSVALTLTVMAFCAYYIYRKRTKTKTTNKWLNKMTIQMNTPPVLEHCTEEQVQLNNVDTDYTSNLGKILFSLDYDFLTGELAVRVIEAAKLPGMDTSGTSDPYIKVSLLPDKQKFETKVHRKTLNPVFNERFVFNVPYNEVASKTLSMIVYDFDQFSTNDQIGQVQVPLDSIDLGSVVEEWVNIDSPGDDEDESTRLGDICFSLRYGPASGKLVVVILEAKNLKRMDITGLSDPFVRVVLKRNSKRKKVMRRQKSSVKRNTLNPYFNESFRFEVPVTDINDVTLKLTVVDYDRFCISDPIGHVELGSSVTGPGRQHWIDMLARPLRPIARWHTLEEVNK